MRLLTKKPYLFIWGAATAIFQLFPFLFGGDIKVLIVCISIYLLISFIAAVIQIGKDDIENLESKVRDLEWQIKELSRKTDNTL